MKDINDVKIQIINAYNMRWINGFKKVFPQCVITDQPYIRPKPDVMLHMWFNENTVEFINSGFSNGIKQIVFIRRFEYYTSWIESVDWKKIDGVVMVNNFLAEGFKRRTGITPNIIYNAVNTEDWTYRERDHGKIIAMVGFVNQRKNLPLALQILEALPEGYELHVAGACQDPATWDYIVNLAPHLPNKRVKYDGQIENIDAWLEDKNYLLCTAISEGNPNNVLEAMAKGIKPVVHNWPGSDVQFKDYIFSTVPEAVEMMLPGASYNSEAYRSQVEFMYGHGNYNMIKQLILEVTGNKQHTAHRLDWAFEFHHDIDVFFLSYPKTGRTWIRLFLQMYLNQYFQERIALIGNLFYPVKTKKPKIFFTHTLLNYNPNGNSKTVLMIRDPRDMLVSSYFHNTRRSQTVPKDYPISQYIRDPASGIDLIFDWYHKALIKLSSRDWQLISYEHIHQDPETWFSVLLNNLKIPIDKALLTKCVESCNFENLQKGANSLVDHPEKYRYLQFDESDPESHKFRKGKVGGYKNYLGEEDIAYLNERARDNSPFPEWCEY